MLVRMQKRTAAMHDPHVHQLRLDTLPKTEGTKNLDYTVPRAGQSVGVVSDIWIQNVVLLSRSEVA